MANMDEFIKLIRQWIDKAIYVWGGQGQPTNEADIRKSETSVYNADRAIALYIKRKAEGIDPVIKFDCSGLIVWALQQLVLISYDTTANGLLRKSIRIKKSELRLGDFVFRVYSDGDSYHVGVVTRIENGTLYVTEARGRDYGVIETRLDAIPNYWHVFGRNTFIKESNVELKLGSVGEAVKAWQENLNKVGNALVVDGEFGKLTDQATRNFQEEYGLVVDGIVGVNTYAKMDEVLNPVPIDYKALYEEAIGKINKLNVEIQTLKDELAIENKKYIDCYNELVGVASAFEILETISQKY